MQQQITQEKSSPEAPGQEARRDLLEALMDPEPYRLARASHVLRTRQAFLWLLRGHQQELVECGAMLKLSGRWMVHADRFDEALVQIGRRMARGA